MKKMLLLIFIFFSSFLNAQKLTKEQGLDILKKMQGRWRIESNLYIKKDSLPKQITGKAKFSLQFDYKYIHEQFEVTLDGKRIFGEAFITYSAMYNRFELLQVDNRAYSSIVLVGSWDETNKVLAFRPVEGHPQWGSKGTYKMYWDYHFYDDGTFKKTVQISNKEGKYELNSGFHYFPKK